MQQKRPNTVCCQETIHWLFCFVVTNGDEVIAQVSRLDSRIADMRAMAISAQLETPEL